MRSTGSRRSRARGVRIGVDADADVEADAVVDVDSRAHGRVHHDVSAAGASICSVIALNGKE